MHINHIAIWTQDLERLVEFYAQYFDAQIGPEYHNPRKAYRSRFLTFSAGTTIEIASITDLPDHPGHEPRAGFAHLAFSSGSVEAVDILTEQLRDDGFPVLDGPRWTGDGFYESAVLDPDGNRIEITV